MTKRYYGLAPIRDDIVILLLIVLYSFTHRPNAFFDPNYGAFMWIFTTVVVIYMAEDIKRWRKYQEKRTL